MRRIWIAIGIMAFVISLTVTPALAQEASAPEKADGKSAEKAADEPPAEAEKAEPEEEEITAVTGEKVELLLREGDTLQGVVKGARVEIMVNGRYRRAKDKDAKGAGIRIFYAMGLNGFVFVPYETIEELKFQGALSEDEGLVIARRIAAERRRSDQDRVRVAEELAEKKRLAKEAAAKKKAEEAGETVDEAAEEETAEEKATEEKGTEAAQGPLTDADRAKLIRELLKRYPPEEWKPSRLAEIKDRRLILNIYPTKEEKDFMENYDLWLKGYEIWRKQKDAVKK